MRRTRNDVKIWYCRYRNDRKPGDTAIAAIAIPGITVTNDDVENINYVLDEYGHQTGERILYYEEPREMWANVSPASGTHQMELFGGFDDYDKVIVTSDMSCPIDEYSVLFVDKEPEFREITNYEYEDSALDALYADGNITQRTYQVPLYDYVVRRVAKSKHVISIAVRKAPVT